MPEIVKDLPKMERDDFAGQLEVLVQLICKFEMESGRRPDAQDALTASAQARSVRIRFGWLPPDSEIEVEYEEVWDSTSDNKSLKGKFSVDEHGIITRKAGDANQGDNSKLHAASFGPDAVFVSAGEMVKVWPNITKRGWLPNEISEAFHYTRFKVRLRLILGDKILTIPHDDREYESAFGLVNAVPGKLPKD